MNTILTSSLILCIEVVLVSTEQKSGAKPEIHISAKPEIHIGALFAKSGTKRASVEKGLSELAAAKLAMKHINQNPNFTSDYTLVMHANDTQCDPGRAIDVFYDFMYRKPKLWLIVGPVCSDVAKMLAEIARVHGILLISYGASSPALSNSKVFPTFFRLASSDSSHNDARMHFVQKFKWKRVAILCQDQELFTLAGSDMAQHFKRNNIEVQSILTFTKTMDDISAKMEHLNTLGSRIIFGFFHEDVARHIFCEAMSLGLYGENYVWILLGWYTKNWWRKGNVNCNRTELESVVDGYFAVDMLNELADHRRSMSGYSVREFNEAKLPKPRSIYAPITYDTMWTAAYLIREAMLEEGIDLENATYDQPHKWENDTLSFTKKMLEIMRNIKFLGISGPISFKGPDRVGLTLVMQNQGGQLQRVAIFTPDDHKLDTYCSQCHPIKWKSGTAPTDRLIMKRVGRNINTILFVVIAISCSMGSIMAATFLGFNLFFRKLKYIKLSSPRLNDIVIIGCIQIYIGVILIGIDKGTASSGALSNICTARIAVILSGISMAFGALFMKTYRVYKIFRTPYSSFVNKNKFLKDIYLIVAVLVLTVIDILLVVCWHLSDPLYVTIVELPEERESGQRIIPYLTHCYSHDITKWSTAIYASKGALLLFGAYLAFETRKVKVAALNDSQYIGFSVYSVVVVSVIVVVLSHISTVANKPTWWFGTTSVFVMLSTTSVLCFLFLPKILVIARNKGREPKVNTSIGLKVEAGTRRFSITEPSELYLRAEVRQAEYQRQLKELDKKIEDLQSIIRERNKTSCLNITAEIFADLPETVIDSPIVNLHSDIIITNNAVNEGFLQKIFI